MRAVLCVACSGTSSYLTLSARAERRLKVRGYEPDSKRQSYGRRDVIPQVQLLQHRKSVEAQARYAHFDDGRVD